MNKGQFIFDTDIFQSEIVSKMRGISEKMDDTYKEAVNLMNNDVVDYEGWQGKQKEELVAFLDLITQFHRDLSIGKNSPTNTFYKTISQFPKAVNNYKGDAKSFANLKGVW